MNIYHDIICHGAVSPFAAVRMENLEVFARPSDNSSNRGLFLTVATVRLIMGIQGKRDGFGIVCQFEET